MKRLYRAFKKSPLLGVKVAVDRLIDWVEERRLGIRTGGLIPIETLMEDWQGNHDYAPTSIRALRKFFDAVNIAAGEDVLVDFGCGKGRVLVLAAQYPFRRIIGIEVTSILAAEARMNLVRARGPRCCGDIDVWCGSADRFPLPPDASLLYFFNPFHGEVLERVLSRIHVSLTEHPRRLRIIYNNPFRFVKMAGDYPWLKPVCSFSFEHDCIIYEATP